MKRQMAILAGLMWVFSLPVLATTQREYPCFQLAGEPDLAGSGRGLHPNELYRIKTK